MIRAAARMLDDRRLHLQDGPIDLVIEGHGNRRQLERAFAAAVGRFQSILDELCAELPLLRRPVAEGTAPEGAVARRMWQAVRVYASEVFITPMAAVAGAVADEVLATMRASADLDRLWVNNGGDIAVHLREGQTVRIGLVNRPDQPSLFGSAELQASQNIGGIATSGWRGRSFSLGIADAVTVLAANAAAADAAATVIANAVDLPGHAAIRRAPARGLQPDSDLGDRLVTRGVGRLGDDDVRMALSAGVAVAERDLSLGRIAGAALHLAGVTRVAGHAASLDRSDGRDSLGPSQWRLSA
ncbi:MAG: UPF0280 family protein [Hyphomicrobiales bacterium]